MTSTLLFRDKLSFGGTQRMQTYTTQMDAARKGIITPEMEIVAKKEYRTTEEIRQWVAEGKVAIPANKHHKCLNPEGVGSMLRTKINVNLGVSRDCIPLRDDGDIHGQDPSDGGFQHHRGRADHHA